MFVWMKSDGRGTSVGCCGGIFFLPMALASLLLGLGGDSAWLLFIVLAAIGVLLLLSQLASATDSTGKRKNDEQFASTMDKPKREPERYVLSDDGELIEMSEYERQQRRDSGDTF